MLSARTFSAIQGSGLDRAGGSRGVPRRAIACSADLLSLLEVLAGKAPEASAPTRLAFREAGGEEPDNRCSSPSSAAKTNDAALRQPLPCRASHSPTDTASLVGPAIGPWLAAGRSPARAGPWGRQQDHLRAASRARPRGASSPGVPRRSTPRLLRAHPGGPPLQAALGVGTSRRRCSRSSTWAIRAGWARPPPGGSRAGRRAAALQAAGRGETTAQPLTRLAGRSTSLPGRETNSQ